MLQMCNSLITGDFPHNGPVTQKMFPFDDVIMNYQYRFEICSNVAEKPAKLESDRTVLNANLAVSNLCKILQ